MLPPSRSTLKGECQAPNLTALVSQCPTRQIPCTRHPPCSTPASYLSGWRFDCAGRLSFLPCQKAEQLKGGFEANNKKPIDSEFLTQGPRFCLHLATVDSFTHLRTWAAIRESLGVCKHPSMRDRTIQAMQTLLFPLELHPNIATRFKDALSGRFIRYLVPIPHPWMFIKRFSPNEKPNLSRHPGNSSASEAATPEDAVSQSMMLTRWIDHNTGIVCPVGETRSHTACTMRLSGYLEGDETEVAQPI
jgi:hypothetical protein